MIELVAIFAASVLIACFVGVINALHGKIERLRDRVTALERFNASQGIFKRKM